MEYEKIKFEDQKERTFRIYFGYSSQKKTFILHQIYAQY